MSDNRRKLEIYRYRDDFRFIFPITPFPKVTYGVDLQKQNLLKAGETDVGFTPKSTSISIKDILLPALDNDYSFVFEKRDPNYYIDYLKEFLFNQNNLILRYYSNTKDIFAINCRLKDMSDVGEKDGSKNITIGNLKFEEFKYDIQDKVFFTGTSEEGYNNYGSYTYTVQEGDNLLNIASKVYGYSNRWQILMNKNMLNNPLDIKVGQVLKI